MSKLWLPNTNPFFAEIQLFAIWCYLHGYVFASGRFLVIVLPTAVFHTSHSLIPQKNPTNADHTYRIVQVIAPKTYVFASFPRNGGHPTAGAQENQAFELVVQEVQHRFPGLSPTTMSERGFHLWVGRSEALHFSSIFVHDFPTYFHMFLCISKCFQALPMSLSYFHGLKMLDPSSPGGLVYHHFSSFSQLKVP